MELAYVIVSAYVSTNFVFADHYINIILFNNNNNYTT